MGVLSPGSFVRGGFVRGGFVPGGFVPWGFCPDPDRTSECLGVNQARKIMFMTQAKPIDRLPPSSDALFQHIKRCAFQIDHIWGQRRTLKEPELSDPYC